MTKSVFIKFTKVSSNKGPFTIYDSEGNVLTEHVTRDMLIDGINVLMDNGVTWVKIKSEGTCGTEKNIQVKAYNPDLLRIKTQNPIGTSCVWRHLTDPTIYNFYYGKTEPYIIEYPFAYQGSDQIVQSVKDYTKVYKYFPDEESVSDDNRKIELDDAYFNKAVLYNGQQSTGILNLHPKPVGRLKDYMSYPKFNEDSKSIIFTKADNYYQYNTFWSIVKDKSKTLFVKSCEHMSIDKEVNQENMDYSIRSYKKGTIRAKELKIRHILDDRSDIHLVSQFLTNKIQTSYR